MIDDFNKQINIKKFIKDAIDICYSEGTYICTLRNNGANWILDYLPLGIAQVSGYSDNNRPVVLIDIKALTDAVRKTIIKTKSGKALFFQNIEEEIKASYNADVLKAYKDKDSYAKIDAAYTGVVRINNRGRKYGLSPIFRALSPTLMLNTFQTTDEITAKSRGKKIIHQVLRKECLGTDGKNKDLGTMAFCHNEFMKAFKNNTVVYTSSPSVEKIVYVEPKIDEISVEKVNIYRNKILSSLGISFLANDKSQTASTANISLAQLLRCINSISQEMETVIENFYETLLTVNNIGLEYMPKISIIDTEMLDKAMSIELSKLLYTTFNCSLNTSLELLNISVEDETLKRQQENDDGLSEVFTPRSTVFNSSGDVGKPLDPNSKNPDKQANDKLNNKAGK